MGVIYGPSGCGKSSLVKAGLLPRLSERIFSVYVEATAEDTEARLLKGLRKRCPVNYINWYMAVNYSNWLSEKENLESCYGIR